MFAFNIEILKKSFPNDVQTKSGHRVAGIRRTPLTKGVGYNHHVHITDTPPMAHALGQLLLA